jgi:hypothetical protein
MILEAQILDQCLVEDMRLIRLVKVLKSCKMDSGWLEYGGALGDVAPFKNPFDTLKRPVKAGMGGKEHLDKKEHLDGKTTDVYL